MAAGTDLEREIYEQPAALERLLVEGRGPIVEAARAIRAFDPQWILIAARGTSDNAARYAQYLFGAHNGLAVGLATPSLYTLYDRPPGTGRALVIGISQSGQAPDVNAVLVAAKQSGSSTLAITNDPQSPLAEMADCTVPLFAGTERAVPATKTYTSELLALAMLSTALGNDERRWQELASVPELVHSAMSLNANGALSGLASRHRGARQLYVLGRGFNYATAFEIALKIKEMSRILAEPHSFADLLHGPVGLIDDGFPVLLIAPTGRPDSDVGALLELLEGRAADVVALSDRPDVIERACGALRLPPAVPEWLSPIVAVVPGQLWARQLGLERGFDPDEPVGLFKVTRTH
jgi:glucosamine--fructose-6-phosphate aminotransferase (isomerizing)